MKTMRNIWTIFRRYFGLSISNPFYMGVSLVQPLLYLVLFAPLLKSMAHLQGFPAGGAYNVFVPGLLIQLSLFSVTSAGWSLIAEVRAGIVERMRVTPVNRSALLVGRTLRDITMLLVQAALIVLVAVPFGLSIRVPEVLIAFVLVGLIALLMASVSYAVALLIRDENTFGAIVFSATLPLLLLSGVLLPMTLAPSWLQTVSSFNPLTYAVDAERALFANHVSSAVVLKGLLVIGALAIAAAGGAARAFNKAVA